MEIFIQIHDCSLAVVIMILINTGFLFSRSCYDIVVEPAYFTETLPQQPQNIQIMIPGPPDPPEIFLKSSSPEEFVIEWGEPRLFGGVKVRGYQVHIEKKQTFILILINCKSHMVKELLCQF